MSNPGVVTLETLSLSSAMPVKIEDNLGESVHIHIGPFRFDLTLKELSKLSDDAEVLLDAYLGQFGLSVANFDRVFLGQIGHMLIDLEHASFEEVAVADLLVTVKRGRLGRLKVATIAGSDVIRAMNSDFDIYKQTFGLGKSHAKERIERAQNLVTSEEYGANGERIVVFNDQMFIRDGQHRAATIFSNNPSAKVEVLRIKFRDGRHSVPKAPLLASFTRIRPIHLRRFAGSALRCFSHLRRRVNSKINRIRNIRVNGSGF